MSLAVRPWSCCVARSRRRSACIASLGLADLSVDAVCEHVHKHAVHERYSFFGTGLKVKPGLVGPAFCISLLHDLLVFERVGDLARVTWASGMNQRTYRKKRGSRR